MDMQGSKIAITLPTGHKVEFELMRVGTVAEYRRLLKESEQQEVATQKQAKELQVMSGRMRTAESHSSEVEAELSALKEAIAKRKARAASLFAKLDGGKSVIAQTVEEMLGVLGEIHE